MWRLTGDVEEFLAAAGAFLRGRAAENTVLLTVAETLRTRGPGAFGGDAPLFGWWDAGGAVSGAFLRTPPYPLGLTDLPPPAVPALARALAGVAVDSVHGNVAVVRAFADARGDPTTVRRREWLYRLVTLVPPPAPSGRPVAPTAALRPLLVDWMRAFIVEIAEDPRTAAAQVDNRLAYGGLTLWEHDAAPVSMAGATRPVAGTVRIGPVYTPPEHRRRGYAAALTAHLCAAALDKGVEEVLLFADTDNPISNRLYRGLGFEVLQERLVLGFA